MATCSYCGRSSYGGNTCSKGPDGHCVVIQDGKCAYCGHPASKGGGGCGRRKLGHAVVKAGLCTYCGISTRAGNQCRQSPSGSCIIGIL